MQQEKAVGSVRTWEIVVAALFLAFGAVVVWDSRRLGAQWGSDGPQAGYFPFYIGAIICTASIINLFSAVAKGSRDAFVEWGQLRLILVVLLPTLVYVALIANPLYSLGIYVPSALFIAFDEGGGYWDSGFMQPLDFFGDGPRIPFLVVSPYSKGGRVVHTYYDHVSVLKFIERNWHLAPLTPRSRDNLPNPMVARRNPYVPLNMPAIGDLFEMFDFRHGRGQ